MSKPRIIAFYLPQFYPTPENDEWWGKGFTEWTNVGKAKPLFKGHYQPRIPADLGYYDLRLPEVREQQAELAREAGIEGFCYWHYWFGGKRLLDRIFKEVIESGKPDFPFCLCWANHSWYAKTWNTDIPDKLLIEQNYPGIEDYEAHFYAMLPAFKDKRYIRVDGKLLFGIYAPLDMFDSKLFIDTWNDLAIKHELKGFYFVGFTYRESKISNIIDRGFDAVTIDYIVEAKEKSFNGIWGLCSKIKRNLFEIPLILEYDEYIEYFLHTYKAQDYIHPCVLPNFDHSPRSLHRGYIIHNSTPKKWGMFCEKVISLVAKRQEEKNLMFIKAWNEWGEGNYLEPDLKFGKDYLSELRRAVNQIQKK